MRIVVVHASMVAQTETLATAIADGVQSIGAQATLMGAENAMPDMLVNADAIIWGSSGYFGGPNPKMVQLFDRLGGIWLSGGLQGKVGGVFATTSSMHGGLETVLLSLQSAMMHHGMIVVSNAGAFSPERVEFGCPYGAAAVVPTAITMETPVGQPSPGEMVLAWEFGQRVATVAARYLGVASQYYPRS